MIYSTPPNIVRFAKIFTTGSAETEKNKKQKKQKIWKIQIFTGTRRTQTLHFSFNFNPPFLPEDGQNWKKYFQGKTIAIGMSKYVKINALSPLLLPDYFFLYSAYCWCETGCGHSQRVRIKISHILFYPHGSWTSYCNKILVTAFPSFAA